MTSTFKRLTAAATIAAVAAISFSAPSHAAEEGGVKIGGKLTQVTLVKNAANLAIGKNAKAGLSIGSIHGNFESGGDVTQVTLVKNAVNLAAGKDTEACMSIGSIGDNKACD